ncbi:hypothetical protein SLS62_001150 [Diatrype stigma]|uniref:Prolyl 4-hydroxylase alpha subunit Fe(2+) 2OG dioxygenase domain-containing protein n=1 Tax=Diatrype stigma TaxID=117547 RepID=A0AAN9YW80_9PEZI
MPPAGGGFYGPPPNTAERELRLKQNLQRGLDLITAKGDFAAWEADKKDPDILVNGVGPVHLPLSELQAKELIAKSHQAPYGKGSETIVDTSVRNTWEINPDQFEIRNPQWGAFMDMLLKRLSAKLGVHAPVSAELYKMLIYEKGAMFKAHTDSTHEMSAVSWYSDVSHEVLPVLSGYRFVLTYNLAIHPAAKLPSATALVRDQGQHLRQALESWSHEIKTGHGKAQPLYYVLDHKYTQANLSLRALKTIDQTRMQCLQMICSELEFDLFLTTLEMMEIGQVDDDGNDYYGGYKDHYDDDDDDDDDDEYGGDSYAGGHHHIDDTIELTYTAKPIFDSAGNKIVSEIEVNGDNVIQEYAFGDEPDEEDYEGYMGNSGPSATHWYRRSPTLSQRYQAVQVLTEATESTERLELLVSRAVDDTLNNFKSDRFLSEEDGVALFNLALYYKDLESLKTLGSQIFQPSTEQTSFLLGFLRALRQSTKRKQIPDEEGRRLYKDLSKSAIQRMSLSTATAVKTPQAISKIPMGYRLPSVAIPNHKLTVNYVTPEAMVRTVSSLLEDGLEWHLRLFAKKLADGASLLDGERFNTLWIPVFQDLIAQVAPTAPHWQEAYQCLLAQYLLRFVGRQPQKHRVAVRQVSCRCGDCLAVNRFLADADRPVGRFPLSKQRRQHVHNHLDRSRIDCTHETERRGNPQTLVVTKTSAQIDKSIDEWSKRRFQAAGQLRAFDQDKLRVLLAHQYDDIVDMKIILQPAPQPTPAPAPAPAYTSASASASRHLHSSGSGSGSGSRRGCLPASSFPSGPALDAPVAKRRRTGPGLMETGPGTPHFGACLAAARANPTAQNLAQLDAEIARVVGPPPPSSAPAARTAAVGPSPSSRSIGGSRAPFGQVNSGRSTWRGGGSSPATAGSTSGNVPRRPASSANTTAMTTTTAMIGNKRKIVDVIDLTEED